MQTAATEASCQAWANGFGLHAGVVVPAGHRERLERVCRYALRPTIATDRLQLTGDGRVRLTLRQPKIGACRSRQVSS